MNEQKTNKNNYKNMNETKNLDLLKAIAPKISYATIE